MARFRGHKQGQQIRGYGSISEYASEGLLFRIVFTDALWQVFVGTSIIGPGTGVSYSSLPSLINANTPKNELASANGMNSARNEAEAARLWDVSQRVAGVEFPA